jgi:NOL1/NOP2/sun family putative RNA methylase
MYEIKKEFEERHKLILGNDYDKFREALFKQLPASFRVNTLKVDREEMLRRFKEYGWNVKEVPFYKDGFVFEGKKPVVLGNTLEHFLGYIYIQEAASMIPPVALQPEEDDVILDMAAAPGSKTTQMAQMISNKSVIVANEKLLSRVASLRANLQRCGVENTIVTCMDARAFKNTGLKFDKILLDAPCSGTGAIMKSPQTLKTWSLNTSKGLGNVQKQMMLSAIECLKENGTLVYSTCSLEPEENEENVDWLIKKFGFKVEEIKLHGFKSIGGIASWEKNEFDKQVEKCLRIYPQYNNTEGFFVAKLKKEV